MRFDEFVNGAKQPEKPHEFTDIERAIMEGGGSLDDVGSVAEYNSALREVVENFADGKVKGRSRPGRVKAAGASCKGSVTDLRAKASKYGGEKGKMYHWCANMKAGRK